MTSKYSPRPMGYEFSLETGTSEHYLDSILYDHEYRLRVEDTEFYCEAAEQMLEGPGEILELACGSGRLSGALVQDGHTVFGLDLSPSMLARASSQRCELPTDEQSRLRLFCADMREFRLKREFGLIIMGFNSFEHLYTNADVARCLARVREHLSPGGIFIFDIHHPDPSMLARTPDDRSEGIPFCHPVSKKWIEYSTAAYYDRARQIAFIRFFYRPMDGNGPERVIRLTQRRFFPNEIVQLLETNGFSVDLRLGDFDNQDFGPESPWQILMCRASAV